jgi:hypothetical protein
MLAYAQQVAFFPMTNVMVKLEEISLPQRPLSPYTF